MPAQCMVDKKARRQEKLSYLRSFWGSSGLKQGEVGTRASKVGRSFEQRALLTLEKLGFSDVEWVSARIQSFPFDFIATKDGERVLADATVKIRCRSHTKLWLAKSLGMRLFILHVSPAHEDLHYLQEPKTGCFGIPSSFFHSLAIRGPSYRDTVRMKHETPCAICGNPVLSGSGSRARKYCSKDCVREGLRRAAKSRA